MEVIGLLEGGAAEVMRLAEAMVAGERERGEEGRRWKRGEARGKGGEGSDRRR